MLFAVCVVVAQLDRDYIRDKILEGQRAAASRSNHGGRPQVIDDDTLVFARPVRDTGVPISEIAKNSPSRPASTPRSASTRISPIRGTTLPSAVRTPPR